jgi:hypothetical protein
MEGRIRTRGQTARPPRARGQTPFPHPLAAQTVRTSGRLLDGRLREGRSQC